MSELSIFVDESGDFGTSSGFYVMAMVFHEQSNPIGAEVTRLAQELNNAGLDPSWAIHTGAAIRGEGPYRGMDISDRRREFTRLFAFARRVPITFQTFDFRKREYPEHLQLKGAIARAVSIFLRENAEYLLSFDKVIVYYDNGQSEITDILNTLLNAFFFDVQFRKALPVDYRLFQVADLCCTLELLKLKDETRSLSRSDYYFFGNARTLRKDYLNKLESKRYPG